MNNQSYTKTINILSHINVLMNRQTNLSLLPYTSEHFQKICNQNHQKLYENLKKLVKNNYFNSLTRNKYKHVPFKDLYSEISHRAIIHWLHVVLLRNVHKSKQNALEDLRTKIYQAKALAKSEPNVISNGECTYLMQITNILFYLDHCYWHLGTQIYPNYISYSDSPLLCVFMPTLDPKKFPKVAQDQICDDQRHILRDLDDLSEIVKSLKDPIEEISHNLHKGLDLSEQSPEWALISNFLENLRLYTTVIPKLKKSIRPLSKDSLISDVTNIEILYEIKNQDSAVELLNKIYPQIRLIAKSNNHKNKKAKQKIFNIINKLLS